MSQTMAVRNVINIVDPDNQWTGSEELRSYINLYAIWKKSLDDDYDDGDDEDEVMVWWRERRKILTAFW